MIIDPEGFRLKASWIGKIFAIIGKDCRDFPRILELCNVIVDILIHF
jgi:hypothetical protein